MFPLHTKTFPASAGELERLLNESLRQVLTPKCDPVHVTEKEFPALKQIAIDLDGAQVAAAPPPPPRVAVGQTSPALTAEKLSINGKPMLVGAAAINVDLEARDVDLHQGKDAEEKIVLTLASVADGRVEISTSKADLEKLIAEAAKLEAAKQGVTIEDVRLNLRQVGARGVEGEAILRAKKLFFTATVRITAKLEIDDQLNACISNLNCSGEGAIGSLACGFLAPHLQKLDGRALPLLNFSLGKVRLRDVRFSVRDELRLAAEFG